MLDWNKPLRTKGKKIPVIKVEVKSDPICDDGFEYPYIAYLNDGSKLSYVSDGSLYVDDVTGLDLENYEPSSYDRVHIQAYINMMLSSIALDLQNNGVLPALYKLDEMKFRTLF